MAKETSPGHEARHEGIEAKPSANHDARHSDVEVSEIAANEGEQTAENVQE